MVQSRIIPIVNHHSPSPNVLPSFSCLQEKDMYEIREQLWNWKGSNAEEKIAHKLSNDTLPLLGSCREGYITPEERLNTPEVTKKCITTQKHA